MDDYLRVRPRLFPRHDAAIDGMAAWAELQRRGEAVLGCTFEGAFWFPRTLMGFDKLTMARGEAAMRAEFERLVPLMRSGGFIPSVDHQTPPGVSLSQYRSYLRLLEEYTAVGA